MADTQTVEGSTVLTAEAVIDTPVTPETKLFPSQPPPPLPVKSEPPVETPKTPEVPPEPKAPTEPPKEPAKPVAPSVPTDYDLKLPDGSPLSEEDRVQTLKEAKDAGLTKEQAEARLQAKDQGAKAFKIRQDQALEQTRVQWKAAIAADPEMGGDKQAETALIASRAFKAVASPELQVWVERTGLGDYPEFVRMMTKVGRLIGEDRLITGVTGSAPKPVPPEELLYGKTTPNK